MSYSRWGVSHWFTYWVFPWDEERNADTERFAVHSVASFSAKELRDDMEGCLAKVAAIDPTGPIEELRGYMVSFLADMDHEYADGSAENGT